MKKQIHKYLDLKQDLIRKTIVRVATILILTTMVSKGKAQTVNICTGASTVITAINSSNLTNPSYSINPGGITSSNPAFTIAPASTTTYTLYVTGTNTSSMTVTTSNTVLVQVSTLPAPIISGFTIGQDTLTCFNPTVLVQVAPNPSIQFDWLPFATQGNSIIVSINSAIPTQSLLTTLTLVATDMNNQCQASTVIPIYQNIFQPNAIITNPIPPIGPCSNSVVLTNQSATGIPSNSGFPTNSPVVAMLWEGPSPQPSLAFNTTYTAQATGIYTMTARDNNNGCTKTATTNVILGPVAAFTHTVTNAQVAFTSVSNGTTSGSTYFWNFGDGNSSTLQNPTHTYLSGGAHLVTLQVTNNGTLCVGSVIQSINVSGLPCTSNSSFSMIPTGTAQVWNATPNYPWNVSSARWDWGDGYFSNTLYTSHQYAAAGMYNICLSVTVSCGDTSTSCTSYSVYRTTEEAMILEVNVVAPELVTSIEPVKSSEPLNWNIVPNPNSGTFKLNFTSIKSEPIHVKISDLSGRIVHDQLIAYGSDMVIESSHLVPGMYLLTLQTGNTKTSKRMIVNH